MLIKNLRGIFSGEGFSKRDGRKVTLSDASYIQGPVDILTEGDKILKIGPSLSHASSEVFDGSEAIATPGFIDSHTHSVFSGTRAKEYFSRLAGQSYRELSDAGGGIHNTIRDTEQSSDSELSDALEARIKLALKAGTTTIEVKSGYGNLPDSELRLLKIVKGLQGNLFGSQIYSTYLGLHALPKDTKEKTYVNSRISLLPKIKELGLAHYIDAFPEQGFFSLEESLRFVAEGQRLGLRAKIHADEITDMGAAKAFTEINALSVDHLQKISTEAKILLSQSKTVATLLPATSFFLNIDYAPARSLLDQGARVALATDFNPGTAPRNDFQFTTLLAATQFKMSAAEIFCALTFNAAAAMGLESNRGSLLEGARADILLFSSAAKQPGEALEEIFIDSLKPRNVFFGGRLFRPEF